MTRTPMELAAIASAAVPGLTPTGVASAPDDAADFHSAVLLDSAGKRWRVRSPRHAEASVRLETELHVLRSFTPGVRANLPFLMPHVAGTVRQDNLTTFVYSHLPGSTRTIEQLVAEPRLIAAELGRIMSAIHDLPLELVHAADLPSYTPNEFRQRRLNELDQAATTGKIPSSLLLRWENALEDIALWQFRPSVVHGDLHEDNLLINNGRVAAVNGWTDLRIGDPADDFAWLIAANDQSFADAVLESYSVAGKGAPDRHLLRRAALSAEFALAQWLVRGISTGDDDIVAEAEEMLAALESDIEEYGGQPISVEPPVPTHSPDVAQAIDRSKDGSDKLPPVSIIDPEPTAPDPTDPDLQKPGTTHRDPSDADPGESAVSSDDTQRDAGAAIAKAPASTDPGHPEDGGDEERPAGERPTDSDTQMIEVVADPANKPGAAIRTHP
ncbi:macrolide 2'-phosphotransferase [Arthrobacter sp. H14]|uniref:macrolide 2'-phosphotransferase n=1 Tax=Arthrobacter sp. H14 TaxID=1312959 RepID=UPI0009DE5F07|nr:macrolide 2'-phosphotransferase [Arthrobacter sp. H14]